MVNRYFRQLKPAKAILWCYLIWYLVMACYHFDPSLRLWLTSLGISLVIGIALNLSVQKSPEATRPNHWQTLRLFLMPLCVSSFSAMVKDEGFILIFSPYLLENSVAVALCILFLGSVKWLQWPNRPIN